MSSDKKFDNLNPDNKEVEVVEEDLEDGEIESDEDDELILINDKTEMPVPKIISNITSAAASVTSSINENDDKNDQRNSPIKQIPIIDLVDNDSSPTTTTTTKTTKFKRPNVIEDDFAGNIENAIAAALKKDGIEPPPMPKILEKRQREDYESEKIGDNTTSSSSSSKRKSRKRKKREAEKEKGLADAANIKRTRHNSHSKNEDDDIDDALMYEMLGIRGGSPPPSSSSVHGAPTGSTIGGPTSNTLSIIPPPYYSDDSYSSYDSYDSDIEYRKKGDRISRFNKKNRKDHKSNRDRSRDRGGGRDKERSNRRKNRNASDDGGDDVLSRNMGVCIPYLRGQCQNDDCGKKHEGRPERKLELCKFYLKECCAKKEKCLYMHADFPCKYYYLGMECIYKKECKYMHGEPLSETLRNILLKHIETAPKEILGTFRRISRDYAIQLLNKQHSILCKKYNIENTYAQTITTQSQPVNVMSNTNNNSKSLLGNPPIINNLLNDQNNIVSNTIISNMQQSNQLTNLTSGIPSLLDMIIPSPTGYDTNDTNLNNNLKSSGSIGGQENKPRKSRWTDTTNTQQQQQQEQQQQQHLQQSIQNTKNDNNKNDICDVPNFLKLQYLNGILRQDQIEKLIQLGVETLEQLTTLSLMQLNVVGLTVNQLNEIQLNTMNLEKLGIFKMDVTKQTAKLNLDNVVQSGDSSNNNNSINNSNNNNSNSNNKQQSQQQFGGYLKNSNEKESSGTPFILHAMKASTNDIDMRVLPTGVVISNKINDQQDKLKSNDQDNIACIASPEPQFNERHLSPPKNIPAENKKNERNTSNAVDYSQYLKDSNIDNDKLDIIDDEKDDDQKLIIEEDEDELKIDESAFDMDNEKSNTSDEEGRTTPVGENNFDDNSNSSSKLLPPIIPPVFDQIKSKKVIDLSSTVSNMLKAQAAAATKNLNLDNKTSIIPSYFQSNNDNIEKENEKMIIDINKEIEKTFNLNFDLKSKNGNNNLLSVNNFYGSIETASTTTKSLDKIDEYNKSNNNKLMTQFQDPRRGLIINKNDNYDLKTLYSKTIKRSPSPIKSPQYKEPTMYDRPSIYDGHLNDIEDNNDGSDEIGLQNKADKDMRMSEYMDSGDLDLRLPFKPVMTNFTPATEIDGSVSSNNSIIYRVVEIEIPKPNYKEIRRNCPGNEKTLDPRLRRIFCLQEEPLSTKSSHLNQPTAVYESDSESSNSLLPLSSSTTSNLLLSTSSSSLKEKPDMFLSNVTSTTPTTSSSSSSSSSSTRLDPRKRNNDNSNVQSSSTSTTSDSSNSMIMNAHGGQQHAQQNNDIRMILQKSNWYKNLNSKYKIMINQQLAMVSTELKKFHQNPSTSKIFDITFIMQNSTLQQILTNLCIYIDDNGMIRQIDSDSESSDSGNCNNINKINKINNNISNNNNNIGNLNNNNNINNNNSNNASLAGSILGYPGLLEYNSSNLLINPGHQQKPSSNQLIGIGGNLIDLPNIGNNSMDFLRGPPPLHNLQQQQQQQQHQQQQQQHQHQQHHHQQQQLQQRFGPIQAALNNQFPGGGGGGIGGPPSMNNLNPNAPIHHFGGGISATPDMRPGLLGVAPGIGFNNQFIGSGGGGNNGGGVGGIDNLLPLLSNENLLGNPQFTGVGPNLNFPNFFNDPRNRNNLNKNNNNKRFNNFGMNNNNNGNINNNGNNNNRDRRNNFNDNRNNRDNRNRDKRKI